MFTLVELLFFDPISLCIFGLYGARTLWEAAFPARPLPALEGSKLRGILTFSLYFMLFCYLPLIWIALRWRQSS